MVPSSGSTIQRWLLSVPSMRAAFLAEKAVIRPRLGEVLAQDLLGAPIGGGDEIARPFQRDLQILDLAEIALEAFAGAKRGLDHHIEQCGMVHGLRLAGVVLLRKVQRRRFAGGQNQSAPVVFSFLLLSPMRERELSEHLRPKREGGASGPKWPAR